jgi:MFS family permease
MPKIAPGTFYGWKLVLVLWFIHFLVVGFCFYGPPVLFPLMIDDLGWSRTQISLGFMLSVLTMGLSSPVAAWSVGRFGAKRSLVTGAMVGGLGFLLTQFATTVPHYVLSFGIMAGVGWSFGAVIPVQTLLAYWFNKRRGLAFGIVWSGGATGGLFAPTVLTRLIDVFDGNWRIGWLLMCVIMMAAAVIAGLLIHNKPEDLGQCQDGLAPDGNKPLDAKNSPTPTHKLPAIHHFSQVMNSRPFWLLVVCIVGNVFGWQIILTQSPLHLADRGFHQDIYSIIYGLTVGLTIIGSLGTGALSDRYDPRRIIAFSSLLGLMGSVLFWLVTPDNWWTLSYPLFSAIAIGANAVMPPIFIGKYWDVSSFAKVNGYILPITTLFNSSASPIAGAIFDHSGSYFYALALSWLMLVLAVLSMVVMKPPQARKALQDP